MNKLLLGVFLSFFVLVQSSYSYSVVQTQYSETYTNNNTTRYVVLTYFSDYDSGGKKLRGLLYNPNGASGNTTNEYSKPYFQEFLRKHQFGFIGTYKFDQLPGSSQGLIVFTNALNYFSANTLHPEITNCPIVMYCFSGGSGHSLILMKTNYSKIIAWSDVSGGVGVPAPYNIPNTLNIPQLMIAGDTDVNGVTNSVETYIYTNRPISLLGAYTVIQGGTHSEALNQHSVGMTMLDEAIELTYPTNECVSSGPLDINRLNETNTWLIDPTTIRGPFCTITNYANYSATPVSNAYSIPGPKSAYVYRSFASHNPLISISSPSTDTEANPGSNITINVNTNSFSGWTRLDFYSKNSFLGSITSGAATLTVSNVQSGHYVFNVIGTRGGTNVVSRPVSVWVRYPTLLYYPCPITWYAATNGGSCCGTIGSPWGLQVALTNTSNIKPGDTLLLRGGAYTNTVRGYSYSPGPPESVNEGRIFDQTISGNSNYPILITSYQDEYVYIDGKAIGPPYEKHANARPVIRIGDPNDQSVGNWTIWKGPNIEFLSSSTEGRWTTDDSSFPTNIFRCDGIYVFGASNILTGLTIHDLTTGISSWKLAGGNIFEGNLLYNLGWKSIHNHGHGFYSQNYTNSALRFFKNNLVNNVSDKASQAYGTSDAQIAHLSYTGNSWLNNDVVIGGRTDVIADDIIYDGNYGYLSDLALIYTYGPNYKIINANNNLIVGGRLQAGAWSSGIFTNNIIINLLSGDLIDTVTSPVANFLPWVMNRNRFFAVDPNGNYFRNEGEAPRNFNNWKLVTGYELNSTLTTPLPTTNGYVVKPFIYLDGRGYILSYNLGNSNSVTFDVSALGFDTNNLVRVRNCQNYFVDITTNSIPNNFITLNMQAGSHTVALPYGTNGIFGAKSFPTFGQFIVEELKSPAATNTITIVSANPASGVSVTVSPNDVNGNNDGTTTFDREYVNSTTFNLICPSTLTDKTFKEWKKGGSFYSSNPNASFTVDGDFTVTCVYTNNATNTITVSSSNPSSGVTITNSPADQGSLTSGSTSFTLKYFNGTSFQLIAPLTASGNNFAKWQKNGVDFTGSNTLNDTAAANDTYTAFYSTPPAPPVTNSVPFILRKRIIF